MSRTSSPGTTSSDPPNELPPNGTVFVFDGKPYVVGVDVVVNAFTTQTAEDSDEDRPSGKTLTLSVEHLLQEASPRGTRTTLDEAPHLRRIGGVVRRAPRPIGRRAGRHEARPAQKTTRRVGASSTTSGADPGDDSSDESEPPRCAACGADISHRRRGARTCDATCRKRLSRGDAALPIAHAQQPPANLIDLIDAKARERQAVRAQPLHPGRTIRLEDLTYQLEDLYDQLRIARSWAPDHWPFMGRSASWVILPAPPLARPWATSQAAYERRREAVAA